ncbi:MAG TPA: Vps62-related protein [Gaiellaceae bacterium]
MRPWAGTAVVASIAFAAATTPAAHAAADPAAQLAQKYAPVVRLVEQKEECGHGEPYEPTKVDVVLGSPDVALRGPWDTTTVVKVAPTGADLSHGLSGYNLDFPGDALNPGCTYDEWSHRITAGARPTTYARVVTESAHPGELALQYWFFYLFNDFNDKHEGDWEMVQLDFRVGSAAAALDTKPSEVGYSQHEGAESAHWGDEKLKLVDGTHPVVYAALGSHANYYSSALYLGRSAAEGVGCDDTVGPSRELRPAVALVPADESASVKTFPWLGYVGRWGERHGGFYNGPTGPNTKRQWTEPISWARTSWRDTSYTVPAGSGVGTAATDFFCGAVATGSGLLTALVGDPSPVLIALAGLVALFIWLASRTRWDQSTPFRVRRRRPWGSLVTTALRLYTGHLRLFLGIGLLFVPIGLLTTGIQYALFHGALSPLVKSVGASNALVASLAFALGVFTTLLGLAVVQAATAVAMVLLDDGKHVSARTAYRLAFGRLGLLFRALAGAALVIALLSLSAVGLVIAVWLTIRWSLLSQVVMLDEGASRPLRASARLVRGHWWRVASVGVFVTGIGVLLGPLIGTLCLFVTSASFDFVNLVSALVYVVALPFVAITTTYLYFDLSVRRRLEEEAPIDADVLPAEA